MQACLCQVDLTKLTQLVMPKRITAPLKEKNMSINFEYKTFRPNLEGGESEVTLYLECDVSTSFEEEGRSYFVSILNCTDDNGDDVELTRKELSDVEDIAIDYITGDRS